MTGPISDCGSLMALSLVRTELEGKTVLQVLSALEAGGAELGTLDISAALRDAGARVLVASSGGRMAAGPRRRSRAPACRHQEPHRALAKFGPA